ncbi:exodeoxyribonuclease VII large subunit [Bacillus sp. ISL-40]|uniref:exodeoxyribonuclease VII large subunit n=1 Tax=unclassified Bacillus (in: firmicutes) TaxID=185979 RepID=UPI001BEBD90E|nr:MULTISPECIES: exodeoxyribonuclease VII large subunit [unclassified Bacillus (in: firmicutes)]MBT2698257.1 exodeoxyribonuclease VII large subunit [Bacillus sp. ISL-40]MBT2724580.1 exodeoxyribonuclease VII large subunit [Bacillus sp. ISL-46]MBT2740247.1 exodeoxyribonuclease VII large subunit [Bacillus sp. ISL-77]
MQEQRYLSVNALTKYIKRKFDADPHLRDVHVRGEISNFKQHSSGHMYFTLKDEKARILAVMFSSQSRTMKFTPENGMKVIVRGEISVYEPSGQYQIYIKEMRPDGIGELFLAYEQLKQRLELEGLFAIENKKAIPLYPRTVGVITSPTGAAIRDVITTIKRRYPIANILVFPALVQGDQAAPSIAKAIAKANSMNEIDVLIVGRGGGSIEELWAFNEELVARAIFSSDIPIISAVGHETDFTIADFVADLRAPTPTGAAELAVPHIDELLDRVLQRQTRLLRTMKGKFQFEKERLARVQKSYAFRYPHRLYEQKLEQVDKLTEMLVRGTSRLSLIKKGQHEILYKRLQRNHPSEALREAQKRLDLTNKEMKRAMQQVLSKKQTEFERILSTLGALSPLKIMERGYSLAYSEENRLIKSINQVKMNERVQIQLTDGSLFCRVENSKESEKRDE